MIISIFLAAAGAVYEHFSFGVYSYFMIYAFAVPLAGGALPYMIRYIRNKKKPVCSRPAKQFRFVTAGELYHAAIATLTVGSIIHGALCICGRPNSLVIVYPVTAVALLAGVTVLSASEKYAPSASAQTASPAEDATSIL